MDPLPNAFGSIGKPSERSYRTKKALRVFPAAPLLLAGDFITFFIFCQPLFYFFFSRILIFLLKLSGFSIKNYLFLFFPLTSSSLCAIFLRRTKAFKPGFPPLSPTEILGRRLFLFLRGGWAQPSRHSLHQISFLTNRHVRLRRHYQEGKTAVSSRAPLRSQPAHGFLPACPADAGAFPANDQKRGMT